MKKINEKTVSLDEIVDMADLPYHIRQKLQKRRVEAKRRALPPITPELTEDLWKKCYMEWLEWKSVVGSYGR